MPEVLILAGGAAETLMTVRARPDHPGWMRAFIDRLHEVAPVG